MIAREAVLGDSEVAELLRTRFVPIAIDNVDHPNMTPAEKAFFKPRFDLVLRGVAERVSDCGFSASLGVIPAGSKVPVGMALALADLREDFSLILPHRVKDEGYLK